jgi:hypothetical protein
MSLGHFLSTVYVRGARGPHEYDCWGLTRAARTALYGLPLLPECPDALPGMIPVITREVARVVQECGMKKDGPYPGHVATAWHGRVCVHVGLVVSANGGLRILETDAPTGPCLTRIPQFESRYSKVIYYAD